MGVFECPSVQNNHAVPTLKVGKVSHVYLRWMHSPIERIMTLVAITEVLGHFTFKRFLEGVGGKWRWSSQCVAFGPSLPFLHPQWSTRYHHH